MKIEELRGSNAVVHCTTPESFIMVVEKLEARGLRWSWGAVATSKKYSRDVCIRIDNFNELNYSDLRFYVENGYDVVTDVKFLESNKSILDISK